MDHMVSPFDKAVSAGSPVQRVQQVNADGSKTFTATLSSGESSADPIFVSPLRGSLTNRSGAITAGGTSQELAGANASRSYLFIQNVSTENLWFNFGTAAVTDQPSIKLMPDASMTMEGSFVSTQAVNIVGATTGSKFVAKEG